MKMLISHLDHLVITVASLDRTVAFYRDVLGMDVETFGNGRFAIRVGASQKINIHVAGQEISPHAAVPTSGSADLCFITATPIVDIVEELKKQGIVIEIDPVTRTGTLGPILSIYLRDPDNNLIEVANQM